MELIFKAWWMVAVLPYIILLESTKLLAAALKKHNIYNYWDIWHSFLVVFIAIFIIVFLTGYY